MINPKGLLLIGEILLQFIKMAIDPIKINWRDVL